MGLRRTAFPGGKTLLAASILALGSCGSDGPPAELSGLWSAGPAACAAGMGVRFEGDKIDAVYDGERETLFERPRYRVEARGEQFRVRVLYDLPHQAGGVESAGAYGVLVLARDKDGWLRSASHNLIDARTGTARLRIAGDPTLSFALQPCGGTHPWREILRGRSGA